MGMTIDEIIQGIEVIKAQAEWDYPLDWQIVLDGAIDTMRKYQMMQADYENRLKADFITILTELHLKMEELGDDLDPTEDWDYGYKSGVEDMIQLLDERIDRLKGESDAQEQKKE